MHNSAVALQVHHQKEEVQMNAMCHSTSLNTDMQLKADLYVLLVAAAAHVRTDPLQALIVHSAHAQSCHVVVTLQQQQQQHD
jgi:hypothetical protein